MVYVDDLRIAYRGMQMSHMIADSTDELYTMADTIGLQRQWLQHAGTYKEHFDVSLSKRAAALAAGAHAISCRELVRKIVLRRQSWLIEITQDCCSIPHK